MKVTIITPSFNQAEFIRRAISSARNQKVEKQYLVIDGKCNDGSLDIVKANNSTID